MCTVSDPVFTLEKLYCLVRDRRLVDYYHPGDVHWLDTNKLDVTEAIVETAHRVSSVPFRLEAFRLHDGYRQERLDWYWKTHGPWQSKGDFFAGQLGETYINADEPFSYKCRSVPRSTVYMDSLGGLVLLQEETMFINGDRTQREHQLIRPLMEKETAGPINWDARTDRLPKTLPGQLVRTLEDDYFNNRNINMVVNTAANISEDFRVLPKLYPFNGSLPDMMSLFLLVFFLTIRVVSTRPDVDSAEDPDLATIQMEIKDGSRFMYGTTLAGWLVADYSFSEDSPLWKDVPPEIANQGEYATMQYLGQKEGKNRMKKHRATFYKEQDFADIAAAGLNVVRIPVGYWIAGHDDSASTVRVYYPYAWKDHAPGAMNLLDKVIRIWALKHKLLVIINLHAAKGSQNGYGNSAPLESGNSSWWRYPANVNNSLDVVELLAKRYNSDKAFLGIGLLNEPVYPKKTVNHGLPTRDFLQQYYYDAYGRIRNDVSSGCLLFMSPLLHEQDSHMTDTAEVSEDITKPWDTFMVDSVENIRFEWHLSYLSGYDNYTADELLRKIAVYKNNIQAWEGNPLFIGEWNLASAVNMTRSELKRFSKIQMDSFSIYPVTGWSFNAWKHYGDNEKLDKFAPRAYNLDDKDRRSMKALLRSKILPYL